MNPLMNAALGATNESDDPYQRNRDEFVAHENKNVFVIMRYASEPTFNVIERAIGVALGRHGLRPILARKVAFHEELWGNIRFCMDHSRYAIAVFERLVEPDFNPNITTELGYMLALRRPCLILKDRQLRTMPSDILGHLYHPFDLLCATETVTAAVEEWLRKLGHMPSAETITGTDHASANIMRTGRILEALASPATVIRQAASLSALAISAEEAPERDCGEELHKLWLRERDCIVALLEGGCVVRVMICPDGQIDGFEMGLMSDDYARRNILARLKQLERVITEHLDNESLQICYAMRLPHDNSLIIDSRVAFIGRKRRRERGFAHTTQIFDPVLINDESAEFDAIFLANVGAILRLDAPADVDCRSRRLKEAVLVKLASCQARMRR